MSVAALTKTTDIIACVVLGRGAIGLHAGIAYRRSDRKIFTIHLAWHHDLRSELPDPTLNWLVVSPLVDPVEQEVLSGLCELRESVSPDIPYGLDRSCSYFDPDGNFVPVGPGIGLTCASFVMAMYDWAGITLLDSSSWRERPEDRAAQAQLVTMLRNDLSVSRLHVRAVEREVGCFRYRSEEVAAATAWPSRPLAFEEAEGAGRLLLERVQAIYAEA